jgi:4-amino-4-deoxy-L-arabinose transferase-like glycosyltransferase
VRPLHALIALQLAVIVVFGVLTAVRYPFFSPIDEAGHFDYVRIVAEEHRLPVLGEDKLGYAVLALDNGLDPDARPAPHVERPEGLPGESYQAFEPPLYYLLVAPVLTLTDDWSQRVKLVRLADLVFLLAAAAVLYRLAGRVLPQARLPIFGLALTVLMWPGVILRTVTVSNAGLELLMACILVYVLWVADEDRSERWLLLGGATFGLAMLTKLTLIALAPLLLLVAVRHVLRSRDRRAVLIAVAAVALPLVVMSPWLIFNLVHYDALTPNSLAKMMQEPSVNPNGITYTVGRFMDRVPQLFEGILPQDWALVPSAAPLMGLGFDFLRVAVFGLPVLLLLVDPGEIRRRQAFLLAAPFLLGFAMVAWVTLVENWPIGTSRRLYAETPALALFAGFSCLQLFRSKRVIVVLAVASSLVLAAAWVDLTSRFLL